MPGIQPQARRDALFVFLILFALVVGPAVGFLFLFPFNKAEHQRRINHTYVPVEARIVSSSVRTYHGSKGYVHYIPEITYAYEVNGAHYQSSQLRAFYVSGDEDWANEIVSHYRPRQTYKAWYNPLKPDEAVLIHSYSFSPYFDMLEATFCVSGVFCVWLVLWFSRKREPVPADNGMFKLFPQFSAEQHLAVAQAGTAIWYGLGAVTAAHYLCFVPSPHSSYALHLLMLFAVVGLIPVGVMLRYYRPTRYLGAPLLLLNRPVAAPEQEFKFTISQQARRQLTLTSVNVWLECDSIKSKGRNNREVSTLHKEHPIALRNHPLRAGEPLELSGALTIPPGLPVSGRDPTHSRTWIHWDITLECRIKGGPHYETKFPVMVTATPVEDAPRPADLPSRAQVQVQDISSQPAARILSKGHVVIAYLLGMIPVYFLLIGMIAMGVTYPIAFNNPVFQPPINLTANEALTAFIAGGCIILASLVAAFGFPNIGTVYMRRLATRTIRQRPGAIVNPEAKDALFVDVVPRSNWNRFMWENAADIGFLAVDLERREILFEGDRQRYRIPAESMSSCTLEKSVAMQSAAPTAPGYWLVVVRAYDARSMWEAPFSIRRPKGRTLSNSPPNATKELHARISSLLPKASEKSTSLLSQD